MKKFYTNWNSYRQWMAECGYVVGPLDHSIRKVWTKFFSENFINRNKLLIVLFPLLLVIMAFLRWKLKIIFSSSIFDYFSLTFYCHKKACRRIPCNSLWKGSKREDSYLKAKSFEKFCQIIFVNNISFFMNIITLTEHKYDLKFHWMYAKVLSSRLADQWPPENNWLFYIFNDLDLIVEWLIFIYSSTQ